MPDLQRLIDGFDAGELVRPFSGSTSLIDVVRASAKACGVHDIPMNNSSRAIADHLKRAEHLVFVLADGLGIQFIDQLPRGSWLRRHTRRTIQATFPPTTPVALTTIATGDYPACHGITGWWTHLPSLCAPVTVFHNSRSTDDVSLDDLGVNVRELFPREPLLPRMQRDVALLMPANVVDTPFTRYMAGGKPCIGYTRPADASRKIAERIAQAAGPTFTYWYTPYPDSLAHEHGTHDDRVMGSVEDLDAAIGQLVCALREHEIVARIVITADHGHLDVGGAGHLEVAADDALLEFLTCPPSGDMRTLYWHVRPGRHREFARAFKARFGEWFLLLSATDVERVGLFGPDLLSDTMRARVGDFVTIALGREVLRYAGAPGHERYLAQRSHHSGLSAAEMHVPLILIGTEGHDPPGELDFTARRRQS
ncbi:MAG: alkaline phosphatase family protein [Dehalococcoidia bacterium]